MICAGFPADRRAVVAWEKDGNGGTRKGLCWSVGVSCDVISAAFHALQGACIWGIPYVSMICASGRSSCCCCRVWEKERR